MVRETELLDEHTRMLIALWVFRNQSAYADLLRRGVLRGTGRIGVELLKRLHEELLCGTCRGASAIRVTSNCLACGGKGYEAESPSGSCALIEGHYWFPHF